jgi:hypothetical protein
MNAALKTNNEITPMVAYSCYAQAKKEELAKFIR